MQWFKVSMFANPELQEALDYIIYILNPYAKLQAHLTLRGPFKKLSVARRKNSHLSDNKVSIIDVGRFSEPRKVVYLRCDSHSIREIWWKRDFEYNPHITLYAGDDSDVADEAYRILKSYKFYAVATLADVNIIRSLPNQREMNLVMSINHKKLGDILGINIDMDSIKCFSSRDRLIYLERLADNLSIVFMKT